MKKILLGISMLLVAAFSFIGFKGQKNNRQLAAPVQKTLNGYDMATAKLLIHNYASKSHFRNDNSAKSFSVWFNKAEITAMYTVLMQETSGTTGVTGVRFYLGSDLPGGSAILNNLQLLLVTTKIQTQVPSSPQKSEQSDYYNHNTALLNTPMGQVMYKQSAGVFTGGGSLFGKDRPKDGSCEADSVSSHFLQPGLAYRWVQNRSDNDASKIGYNTISDTFSADFIEAIFKIISTNSTLDGLRVYLGYGSDPSLPVQTSRDIIILVPTYNNRQDYYNCLENLGRVPKESLMRLRARDRMTLEAFAAIYGGAYDRGELCPETCDIGIDTL